MRALLILLAFLLAGCTDVDVELRLLDTESHGDRYESGPTTYRCNGATMVRYIVAVENHPGATLDIDDNRWRFVVDDGELHRPATVEQDANQVAGGGSTEVALLSCQGPTFAIEGIHLYADPDAQQLHAALNV